MLISAGYGNLSLHICLNKHEVLSYRPAIYTLSFPIIIGHVCSLTHTVCLVFVFSFCLFFAVVCLVFFCLSVLIVFVLDTRSIHFFFSFFFSACPQGWGLKKKKKVCSCTPAYMLLHFQLWKPKTKVGKKKVLSHVLHKQNRGPRPCYSRFTILCFHVATQGAFSFTLASCLPLSCLSLSSRCNICMPNCVSWATEQGWGIEESWLRTSETANKTKCCHNDAPSAWVDESMVLNKCQYGVDHVSTNWRTSFPLELYNLPEKRSSIFDDN